MKHDITENMEDKGLEILANCLSNCTEDDIMHLASAVENLMKRGKQQEYQKKLSFVKKYHVKGNGDMRSIITINRDGKEYYYTKLKGEKTITAKTLEELIDKLYLHYSKEIQPEDFSVGKAWKMYVADYRSMNPTKTKTLRNIESEYDHFISKEFAERDIRKITAADIERYAQKLIAENDLKKKAFLNFKSLLNRIFDTAVYEGWIAYNPAKNIRNNRLLEMCDQSLSARETEDVLLSEEEWNAVFAEIARRKNLKRNKGYYYFDAMIRLHAEIGCRPGELCAIRWKDIKTPSGNQGSPSLHIHAQIKENGSAKNRYEYVPVTKNEKGISRGGRYFPLTQKMRDILMEVKAMQESKGVNTEYVFAHLDGSFILPEAYAEYVHSVFQRVGIQGKTSYVFRRGVNQLLDERGVSPTNRAKLLGHTVQTNLTCYTFGSRDIVEIGRQALESK